MAIEAFCKKLLKGITPIYFDVFCNNLSLVSSSIKMSVTFVEIGLGLDHIDFRFELIYEILLKFIPLWSKFKYGFFIHSP